MIEIVGLGKHYRPGQPVLDGLDLTLADGESAVLLGASGSGKSTLLRLIAGLERPDAGSVRLAGRVVADARGRCLAPRRRGLGMLFQDLALWPHLSALDNVRLGLQAAHGRNATERAIAMLAETGIDALARRRPHQLSGGQRQRLALARALAPGHRLLLLDEPFNNLDPALKARLLALLRERLRRDATVLLHVTHQLDEALALGGCVLLLRAGRIGAELQPADLADMTLETLERWYLDAVTA